MIPRFKGRLARLGATAVLAEYLGPRFEGVGKRLVVTVTGQGADLDDFLYRKYCNPAPLDGSAPNLVITETDSQGHVFYKRAFNTQACEQLNAWIGVYS